MLMPKDPFRYIIIIIIIIIKFIIFKNMGKTTNINEV